MKPLHDSCKKVRRGEFTTTNLAQEELDYQTFYEIDFYALVEKSFFDINSVVRLFIKSIPLYYSGLVDKNTMLLKKEDLMNHFMSQYITEEVYDILFTFSRVSTIVQEEQLLTCIQK